MMCLRPISLMIQDKNTGLYKRQNVPCSKCIACINKRRQDWAFRNEIEFKHSYTAYFVTMTYDDDHLIYKSVKPGKYVYPKLDDISGTFINEEFDLDETIDIAVFDEKREIQLFLKRLRKMCEPCHDIKYFFVTEYGSESLRPHFHFLLYNFPGDGETLAATLEKLWDKGFVYIGSVTNASISYVCKYMMSFSILPSFYPKPYMMCSKGLGKSYLSGAMINYHKNRLQSYAVKEDGIKCGLPRYLRAKIFSDEDLADMLRQKVECYVERAAEKEVQKLKYFSGHGYYDDLPYIFRNRNISSDFRKSLKNSLL